MNIEKGPGIYIAFSLQENSLFFHEFDYSSLVASHCVRSLTQQLILEIRD
jgi:hypothetical protein